MNGKDSLLLQCLGRENAAKTLTVKGLCASAPAVKMAMAVKAMNGSGKGKDKDRRMHIAVLPDADSASTFASDLYNYFTDNEVYLFTSSDDAGSRNSITDSTRKVQRTSAIRAIDEYTDLREIAEEDDSEEEWNPLVIVTYNAAVAEPVLKKKEVKRSILTVRKGEKKSFDEIRKLFFENNFRKVEFVTAPGEFAIRGSLIDVFSYDNNMPYRIDFFSDEVEKITEFDNNTQLSIRDLQAVEVYPNLFIRDIQTDASSLFDRSQIPADTVVWLFDPDLYEKSDWYPGTEPYKRVLVGNLLSVNATSGADLGIEFRTEPQPAFNKNFDILCADLEKRAEDGYRMEILSDNHAQIERLTSILRKLDHRPKIVNMSLHDGFIDHDEKVCVYTDHQIFERYHKIDVKRQVELSERITLDDLNALKPGDYVVHIDYGVGVFSGLVRNELNGREGEYVRLEYKDDDVLLVPVNSLNCISRFKSKDGVPPKVYNIGSKNWQSLKDRTKKKVKDIAKDLISLYGQRSHTAGFEFSPDTYMQEELESSFMYEDTPDQSKATKAVKEDMEKPYPMDRLVCGDVGFGKTEVAIRAAFKAVSDSKQVAVLVPTTILALQHYNTFTERLKNFPCRIDYLSRMRSNDEIKRITEEIASGKIDIIIGTHRLLNKQIKFKDLGLLVIDEEQKFGVAAKERLRQLKTNVDTLTLTATPIPRTLQFSLMRARDMSVISTPPPNRLPIHTEIIDFDEDRIRAIILQEMRRGGQAFYLHNRVDDIIAVADMVHRIVPQARVGVAHGQMDPDVLENRMIDFMQGDYDVLVCTTIIENGLDIPNANTIIINQAQNFGLSDLHQLRGRVGRSNRQAYCYLITNGTLAMTDDARRRLQAIETFSDLGSGFNIAMQDLDIRGAGNLLGAEQSGFIAEMGYETYKKILDEALNELDCEQYAAAIANGQEPPEVDENYVTECRVDTDFDLYIPDEYVNVESEKLRLYKELDSMEDDASIARFTSELEDRFGKMPHEVEGLIQVVKLRHTAQNLGLEKIVLKGGSMVAGFISNPISPYYIGKGKVFDKIMEYIQKEGNRFALKQRNERLFFSVKGVDSVKKAADILNDIEEYVQPADRHR